MREQRGVASISYFRVLERKGRPMSSDEVAKHLRVSRDAAQKALNKLAKYGWAVRIGSCKKATWALTGIEGKPLDSRGKSDASRKNLAIGRRMTQDVWKAYMNGAPIELKTHPRPYKATALEQAIGWGVERD